MVLFYVASFKSRWLSSLGQLTLAAACLVCFQLAIGQQGTKILML